MSTTPQIIITNAMTLMQIIWPGSTPSATMSADGLVKLNDLLASWTTDRLMIFAIAYNDWTLVSGTNSYTIGAGGTFSGTRPISIHAAQIIAADGTRWPMQQISTNEWNGIKDRAAGSKIPSRIYSDGQYPLTTLFVWPTPNAGSTQLELQTWQQLTQFATLADTFDFPPGYERAITYALAVELAPEYHIPPPEQIMAIASDAKQSLKMLNAPPTHIPGAAEEAIVGAQAQQEATAGTAPPQG